MGDAWATAQVFLNGAARERGIHVLGQAREAAPAHVLRPPEPSNPSVGARLMALNRR
jgi:hypothetical protein